MAAHSDRYEVEIADKRLKFLCPAGVKKRDYYEEAMVETVLAMGRAGGTRFLNLAAGHGFTAVLLASLAPSVRVVASDINPAATAAIRLNAELNGLAAQIDVRRHSKLFDSVPTGERFDGIVAALPPIPLTVGRLRDLDPLTRAHHYVDEWGVGGGDGRRLIDLLIIGARERLELLGYLVHVHADFLGTQRTLDLMTEAGFRSAIAEEAPVLLESTRLTLAQRPQIESLGYEFHRDGRTGEYFMVQAFLGQLVTGEPLRH